MHSLVQTIKSKHLGLTLQELGVCWESNIKMKYPSPVEFSVSTLELHNPFTENCTQAS